MDFSKKKNQIFSLSYHMKASVRQLHTYWHASEGISSPVHGISYLHFQSHFSFLSQALSSCSLIIPKEHWLEGSEEQSLSESNPCRDFLYFLGLIFPFFFHLSKIKSLALVVSEILLRFLQKAKHPIWKHTVMYMHRFSKVNLQHCMSHLLSPE